MRKLILICALFSPCLMHGAITHQAANCSAAASGSSASNSFTFSCTPQAANNAVVFMVGCSASSGTATSVSLTATGWTITAMTTVKGSTTAGWAATFAALAPNTSAATFTATFTGLTNCSTFTVHLHDEFSGNDTTGGVTTFYANNGATATTGGCSGAASTSSSANDAVWGACEDSLATTNWQGAGWTKGVTDSGGEGTEWKLATGSVTPAWASTSGAFNQFSVVIKAASGAAATCNPTMSTLGVSACG